MAISDVGGEARGSIAELAVIVPGLRRRALLVGALSFASSAAEGAMFVALTAAGDAAVRNVDSVRLFGVEIDAGVAVIVGSVLLIAKVALAVSGSVLGVALGRRSLETVRRELSAAMLATAPLFMGGERIGGAQDRLTTWCERVAGAAEAFSSLVSAYLALAAFVMVAAVVDHRALIVLGVIGTLAALLLRPAVRRVRSAADALRIQANEYAGEVGEAAVVGGEVAAFGVQAPFQRGLDAASARAARAWSSARLMTMALPHAYQTLMFGALFAAIAYALVAGASGSGARLGAVVLLLIRTLSAGQQIVTYRAQLAGSLPYVAGVRNELDRLLSSRLPDGTVSVDRLGSISLRQVGFSYSGDQALTDVGVVLERGASLAVVGPSGAGKTTLARLLLRQAIATEGIIEIQGVNLSEVRAESWSALTAPVAQQPVLISGTVADNVRFHRDLSDDAVSAACERANLLAEVEALPDGLATQLHATSGPLSGGQRQRLALARALAGSPELIVLDEPTSALDVGSEARIARTLEALKGSVTTVVIAHRWATVAHCDQVLVLENGKVAAVGNIDDVLLQSDFLRKMRDSGTDRGQSE